MTGKACAPTLKEEKSGVLDSNRSSAHSPTCTSSYLDTQDLIHTIIALNTEHSFQAGQNTHHEQSRTGQVVQTMRTHVQVFIFTAAEWTLLGRPPIVWYVKLGPGAAVVTEKEADARFGGLLPESAHRCCQV